MPYALKQVGSFPIYIIYGDCAQFLFCIIYGDNAQLLSLFNLIIYGGLCSVFVSDTKIFELKINNRVGFVYKKPLWVYI